MFLQFNRLKGSRTNRMAQVQTEPEFVTDRQPVGKTSLCLLRASPPD